MDLARSGLPWEDASTALSAKYPYLDLHFGVLYRRLLAYERQGGEAVFELERFLRTVGRLTIPSQMKKLKDSSSGATCPSR